MLMAAEFPDNLVIAGLTKIKVWNAEPWRIRRRNPVHGIAMPFNLPIPESKSTIAEQVEAPRLNLLCAFDDTFAFYGESAPDFRGHGRGFISVKKKSRSNSRPVRVISVKWISAPPGFPGIQSLADRLLATGANLICAHGCDSPQQS
jgi:hypothetical protein